MKIILTLSVLLILAVILSFVLHRGENTGVHYTPPDPPVNISSIYIIGAMDCGYDIDYRYIGSNDLGLNLWHRYANANRLDDSKSSGWDWYASPRLDNLYNPLAVYRGVVTSRLQNNLSHGLMTLMGRPKIDQLAYGQRSDYQCEETHLNDDLWFYSFNNHDVREQYGSDYRDNSQYGSGEWVRRCKPDPVNAPAGKGFVVRRLKANGEQCNTNSPLGDAPGDLVYEWLIKPRIRADKDYVDKHSDEPICRIDVYNFNGTLIKSADIRARNFKDGNNHYNGKYTEEFRFNTQLNDSTLTFSKTDAINFNPNHGGWAFNPRGTRETDRNNKMDIQVYWYGYCEIFIDYVRVDNDIADGLFKGYFEGNDPQHPDRKWLQWEAELGTYNSSPLKFYIEEFEFNNIPCMSYVSRKLKEYSHNDNLSLMSVVNPTQMLLQLPVDYVNNKRISSEFLSRYLIDSVGESQVFSEPYSLTGKDGGPNFNDSKIPSSLGYSYNFSGGILGDSVSPDVYDTWLQEHLDAEDLNLFTKRGYFTWYLKTMDTMSKAGNIPHINMVQTHLFYNPGEEVLREPTNEELEMTTLVPVTYGAKGTIFFAFQGWGNFVLNHGFCRGLVDPSDNYPYLLPRMANVYGQPKWEKIKSINQKLKEWSPYLMSFDNRDRHSYIYRDRAERRALLADSYFRSIVTYKHGNPRNSCTGWDNPGADPPPAENGLEYECQNDAYLQVATFKNPDDSINKYFMIVNRRCSPVKAGYPDGSRKIKVLFDNNHSDMAGSNNWKIINIGPPYDEHTFDKIQNLYVDLGRFEPGEGRLYKMVPVKVH